ncbi:MAG: hypothetical protein Q9225_006554 [Loekoesia sp. 1 TL-2023]
MDHIPLPHGCSFRHIQVPYLDSLPLDNESWYTYPERHGWQVNQNREQTVILWNGEKRPVAENAMFVQSWLYFGLQREIFRDQVDMKQFIREEANGKRYISTDGLENLLGAWTAHFTIKDDTLKIKRSLDELYRLLIEHRTICLRMYRPGIDFGDDSIMMSIAVLSERLMAAVIDLYAHLGLETPVEQRWRLLTKGVPDIGQPILSLMRARGWCPYDLRRLDIEIREVSILYYYSNLKAPRSFKDHSNCSEERCLAMLTNLSTYRLSHRHRDCVCPLQFADQNEVAKILEQGSIPLINMTIDTRSKASKIAVRDLAQGHEFVAISHVWAEGAGNVHDNALQTCLLEDISQLVKKLPWEKRQSDKHFWIDTLCVPVRPLELQTLALNKMRVPYERAKHVLILDSHLRSLDSRTLSPTEIFAQVSCSSWMRRLWTLQEGRLAKNVWFQFADEAIDVKSIFSKLDRRRIPSKFDRWIDAALYIRLWIHIWYRGDEVPHTSTVAHSISLTSHALASRSVSIPTDEALCLFTLMNKDLTQITAIPPARRMEVFWRTFGKVPKGLLFSKAPNKMSEEGLHWAPSSFMGFQSEKEWLGPQEINSPREDDPHAIPVGAGLQVALPGFILHRDLIGRMKQFDFTWNVDLIVQDGDGTWYAIRLEEPWRQGSDVSDASQQLAVVLAHELQMAGLSFNLSYQSSEMFSFQDHSVGILVAINRIKDDIMYVTAHNHVTVELLGEGTQRYLSTANACSHNVDLQHSILSSESHTASKERYKTAAQQLLEDKDTMDLLAGQARHLGGSDGYGDLLDDLLDMTVVAARFGDRSKVLKIAASQQWCVD